MFRDVPECSWMFRNVSGCSMFRVLSTARKYRAAWNFLQIYLWRYQTTLIGLSYFYTSASLVLKCLLHKDAFIIHQNEQIGDGRAEVLAVFFSPRFSCLFCLLSSRILQINLFDLYFVEICRQILAESARDSSQLLKNGCVKLKSPRGLRLGT